MSRILKLYPQGLPSVVEQTGGLERDPNCRRCDLHYNAGKSTCLPFRGEPGGLLTVGSFPDGADLQAGQPNQGRAGRYLNDQIARYWDEPIAHGLALGCPPPQGEPNPKQLAKAVGACRPYVAQWIRDVQPTRILALGGLAIQSLLGRSPPINSVRRGFGWYTDADWLEHQWDDEECRRCRSFVDDVTSDICSPAVVPIIFLMHPAATLRQGKFAQRAFEGDLEWALKTPDSFFQERYRLLAGGTVEVIETEAEAERVFVGYRKAILNDPTGESTIVHDVETRGKLHDPSTFRLVSVAVALRGSADVAVFDRHAIGRNILKPYVEALHDPALRWSEQSDYDNNVAMYLWGTRDRFGIQGECRDVRLLRMLGDTNVDGSLDVMSNLVGQGGFKSENSGELAAALAAVRNWDPRQSAMFDTCPDPEARQLLWQALKDGHKSFKPKTYLFALIPTDTLTVYNARDVVSTGLVDELCLSNVRAQPNLSMIWDEVESLASWSFAVSSHWGVPISKDACDHVVWYANEQQRILEPQLRKYCGPALSLSSPKQIAAFIFGSTAKGGLGIQPTKTTKKTGQASTDKEALKAVADRHPFCQLYASYAHWDGFREKAEEFLWFLRPDGRIHPTYLTDGTATGRGSAKNGNVYNMRRAVDCRACKGEKCAECDHTGLDAESRLIRDMVAAPPGWSLVEVDGSQAELRGQAVVSGDPFMTAAYLEDKDIHQLAADAASVKLGKKVARSPTAKALVFGTGYDLSPKGAARQLGCSVKEATELQEAVVGNFTKMIERKNAEKALALKNGYARTLWGPDFREGRHREMWELGSDDDYRRDDALRAVWATLIQGNFSGDKIKEAHARLTRWIVNNRLSHVMQIVFSVYDSINLCVRDDYVALAGYMTNHFMCRIPLGKVTLPDGRTVEFPQKCDMKVGPTYGRAKKAKICSTLAEALAQVKR